MAKQQQIEEYVKRQIESDIALQQAEPGSVLAIALADQAGSAFDAIETYYGSPYAYVYEIVDEALATFQEAAQ